MKRCNACRETFDQVSEVIVVRPGLGPRQALVCQDCRQQLVNWLFATGRKRRYELREMGR